MIIESGARKPTLLSGWIRQELSKRVVDVVKKQRAALGVSLLRISACEHQSQQTSTPKLFESFRTTLYTSKGGKDTFRRYLRNYN